MSNQPVSIAGVGSYRPRNVVGLEFFFDGNEPTDPMITSPVLGPPQHRHHVAPDERAAEMIERAARPVLDRVGAGANDIDLLITNVLLPDEPFTGCGAETAQRLGCAPDSPSKSSPVR